MKTRFFFAGLACLSVFSCSKDEIAYTTEEATEVIEPVNSGTDTIYIDTIYYYYLDGQLRQLNQITQTDDQVWVVHFNANEEPICDVFSSDNAYISWWTTNGASAQEVAHYEACMEIRDYAIENDINENYPDEEDLANYPTEFQEFVLDRIPDYFETMDKRGNDQTTGAPLNRVFDDFLFLGANRTYTKYQGNYGNFNNRTSSVNVILGITTFCDFNWFGGSKVIIHFATFGAGSLDFLGWNNRFNSHF